MKIILLKVRKNLIRRLKSRDDVLVAADVARTWTGPNSQVWAFFGYDLPGQERWHLWGNESWVSGVPWARGPMGSTHSIFEYPLPEESAEPDFRADVVNAAQVLKAVHDNGPVPEPFAEKRALHDLFEALRKLGGVGV